MLLERADLELLLPHRSIALLLERGNTYPDRNSAEGFFKVDEEYCRGHFPDEPIFPGHWMLEAIALTVGIAASPRLKEGYIPLFRRMDRLDFLNPVKINDLVRTEAEVTCQSSRFIEGNGRAFVGDKLVAEAKRIICLIGRGSK